MLGGLLKRLRDIKKPGGPDPAFLKEEKFSVVYRLSIQRPP
jgi:hypothetical protein